jgi:hypothetical protein
LRLLHPESILIKQEQLSDKPPSSCKINISLLLVHGMSCLRDLWDRPLKAQAFDIADDRARCTADVAEKNLNSSSGNGLASGCRNSTVR